jgi:hypothetical protein
MANGKDAGNFSVGINIEADLVGYLSSGLSFNMSTVPDPSLSPKLPAYSQVFYENANTSGIIEDIAASVTDRIRHNGGNVFASGVTLRPLTYIRVDWYWIILPVASVLLSVVALVMTIWENQRRGAPLWKSGLMPLLFHGLEGWSREELRVKDVRGMDGTAKRMRTRMEEDEAGDVRFVRIDD